MSDDEKILPALLPCPMCGHHAAVMYHWTGIGELSHEHCYVECENGDCCLELDQDLPRNKVIELWNTRAPTPIGGGVTDTMVEAALKANYRDIDWEYGAIEDQLQMCDPRIVRGWMRAAILAALSKRGDQ
jgi:hypothetical protein